MKCRYSFPVKGQIRPSINAPVPSRGWLYQFKTEDGIIVGIDVIVPVPNRKDWPKIQENPSLGISAQIDIKTPHLPWIQRELRALQGLLAFFGLHNIELERPMVEWLPESEEERKLLHIYKYQEELKGLTNDEIMPLSFDVIARAVIASDAATDIEVPLNFFRRGMLDVYTGNYIEAIYDFYFVLENQFGNGKFKTAAVSDEFLKSEQLISCVQRSLSDPGKVITNQVSINEQFRKVYGKANVEESIRNFVKLRGYLHHHTSKRRDIWNPEDQGRYEMEALFLQSVTYNVGFEISKPYLWDKSVVNAYEELLVSYKSAG